MAKQPKKIRVPINIAFSEEMHARLEAQAKARDMSLAELIKDLVMLGLKNLEYDVPVRLESLLKGHDPSSGLD